MTFTTPHGSVRFRLPWSWAAFDYRELCAGLCASAARRASRPPRSTAATGDASHRPRRVHAPLVVDAMGWRRVLGARTSSLPRRP